MNRIAVTVLLAATALTMGCASNSKSSTASASASAPVNKVCPMMPDHPVKEKKPTTVAWKGKTVGFCCGDCVDGWNKLSDAEKDKALAGAMAAK